MVVFISSRLKPKSNITPKSDDSVIPLILLVFECCTNFFVTFNPASSTNLINFSSSGLICSVNMGVVYRFTKCCKHIVAAPYRLSNSSRTTSITSPHMITDTMLNTRRCNLLSESLVCSAP